MSVMITVQVVPGPDVDTDVAERMLYTALGPQSRVEIDIRAKTHVFWICSDEQLGSFERLWAMLKIPVEIYHKVPHKNELRPHKRYPRRPPAEPRLRLVG